MDRTLTMDEVQRYLFRLVEDLNFKIQAVEDKSERDYASVVKAMPKTIKGDKGTTYYTWIKYSPNSDGSDMTDLPTATTQYIGISYGNISETESTDPTDYTWSKIKGETGSQGVGVYAIENEYYYSTSPSTTTGGGWSNILPQYDPEKYLWIRQKIYYSDGTNSYTQEAHDYEFDDVLQRATTSEENIDSLFESINGIQVAVDGHTDALGELDDRLTDNEALANSLFGNYNDLSLDLGELMIKVDGIDVSVEGFLAQLQAVHAANAKTSSELAERTEQLTNIIDAFNDYVSETGQYMRHGEDGLELGAEESPFKTVIDNRRMAFIETVDDNGTPRDVVTAYVSGEMFNMVNAMINAGGSLTKGGYQEQVRQDGSIVVVWVGV